MFIMLVGITLGLASLETNVWAQTTTTTAPLTATATARGITTHIYVLVRGPTLLSNVDQIIAQAKQLEANGTKANFTAVIHDNVRGTSEALVSQNLTAISNLIRSEGSEGETTSLVTNTFAAGPWQTFDIYVHR